nr:hypothetical protein [Tanacetum cinerariifolium]
MDSVKTFLRKFYELPKVLSRAWETILEIELAFEDKHCQPEDILELFQRLHNDVQNILEELTVYINTPNWDLTPSLSTEEPDNSLSMGDEHLDTVPATESDEFIKSSVENLVPIPCESEGIPDNMCDVPFHDNSPPLDVLKDQFKDFSDSNDGSTSTDDDSSSIDNIEYVEASPPNSELVSSENPFPFSSSRLILGFDSIFRDSASLGHDPEDFPNHGPTSLGVTSEERANPQLSSDSTTEADPGIIYFRDLSIIDNCM